MMDSRDRLRQEYDDLLASPDIDDGTRQELLRWYGMTQRTWSDADAEIDRLRGELSELRARLGGDTSSDADWLRYFESYTGGDAA